MKVFTAASYKDLAMETWSVCTEELKNPLFHETSAAATPSPSTPQELPSSASTKSAASFPSGHACKIPCPVTLREQTHKSRTFLLLYIKVKHHSSVCTITTLSVCCAIEDISQVFPSHGQQGAHNLLGSDTAKQSG